MPLVAGSLGKRAARLLAILLVILHNLTAVTGTLLLKLPKSTSGHNEADIFESAQYPLLAIVSCSGGQLQVSVNDAKSNRFGDGSLTVRLEENRNKPIEFYLLPNNTGSAIPEGDYVVDILCGNASATVAVNILSPNFVGSQPYFTNSWRTINISASTPPRTVIAKYTAQFPEEGQLREYVLHTAFSNAPFDVDRLTGQLTVSQSLQMEGTLSTYDIVVVANQGQSEAWTLTTITIIHVSTNPTSATTHLLPSATIVGIAVGAVAAVLVVATVIAVVAVVLVLCCRTPHRNDDTAKEYVKADPRVEVPLYPNDASPYHDPTANNTAL